MGFQPARALPIPAGHYQTREQTALFKVLSRFFYDDNNSIILRFWWICPDGNCTSEGLNKEIQRLRAVAHTHLGSPVKRKPKVSTDRFLR